MKDRARNLLAGALDLKCLALESERLEGQTCEGQIWRAAAENDQHGRLRYIISDKWFFLLCIFLF